MISFGTLIETITYPENGKGSFFLSKLLSHLELIKLVNDNYTHIDQLQRLVHLYSYNSNREITNEAIYSLCEHVARITKRSYYKKLEGEEVLYYVNTFIPVIQERLTIQLEIEQAKNETRRS